MPRSKSPNLNLKICTFTPEPHYRPVMLRRIIIAAAGVAVLAGIVMAWYFSGRNTRHGNDPLTAVPADAVIIVRAGSARQFLAALNNRNPVWSDLNTVLGSTRLTMQAGYLDSLLDVNPGARRLSAGKSLYLSLHPSGSDRYEAVFYMQVPGKPDPGISDDVIKENLPGVSAVTLRDFHRTTIREASFETSTGKRVLSWAVNRGILIMSLSPVLVENAILQSAEGTGITVDPVFQKVHSTRGKDVDANIYINLRQFPRYLSSFSTANTKSFLSDIADLALWAELDLHLRDGVILLNGFSSSSPETPGYLDVFSGQSPVALSIESVIPGYASAFLALGISDKELFRKNYLRWMEASGRLPRHIDMQQQFIRLTGQEPAQSFSEFMDREAALVLTGWDGHGKEGESYLVIRTVSRTVAMESLLNMLKFHASQRGVSESSYRQVYNAGTGTALDVYRFPFAEIGELLFGNLFGRANTSWFSFVGNYLVFAASPRALADFSNASVLGRTMDASGHIPEFSEFMVSRNNLHFYMDVPRSAGLFSGLVRPDLAENLADNPDAFRKFRILSLQFSTSRDMLYNNAFLVHSPEIIEEPATSWQTRLDTIIDFKPFLVVNHNTGENEILVQDISNNIYLISNTGRVLWKKPVSGPIKGNVYQIDFYRNNRLQMLFNTRDRIYLVDRNGNDVGRYPVRLPSPATNGISVFDYDNDKNYRIFVASEDRSVTVRSKEGNIVTGWEFSRTDHNVYDEIRFFRIGGRDHIVFADRHRVYITDRRGSVRVRPDRTFPVSVHNPVSFEGRTPLSEPRLALTDTTGRIWHIYFNGRTETITTGNYSASHFFEFHDINGNGFKEYIFLDRNRLEVYSRDGSLLFGRDFPVNISAAPVYYHFSDRDRRLGLYSPDSEQIYLVDARGEISEGFPLNGRSAFTIGHLPGDRQNFSLIVGSGNNFLYNYIVF
jgi:hypothetical protein